MSQWEKQDNNFVSHCYEGKHNKIYIVSIRRISDGTYEVVGKWGRVGRNVSQQIKGTYATFASAWNAALILNDTKIAKGYEDINSASYVGGLSLKHPDVARHLEPSLGLPDVPPAMSPPKSKPDLNEEFIVRCIENKGFEDKFDADVEYVARNNPGGDKFYIVYDKCAKEQTVFRSRFVRCGG